MPDITNPQAVRFCNEEVRVVADLAARYYYAALSLIDEWSATDMGDKIPANADVVIDGSATDGRSPITGAMVNGLRDHLAAMVADLEANGKVKLGTLLKIEVDGSP